jgi:uncharacterized protein with HEPN domain
VRDDRGYLTYILDAIERIERRTAEGREFFMKDDVLQDAVIRRLETLSDAAGKLSDALRDRNPEIPLASDRRIPQSGSARLHAD